MERIQGKVKNFKDDKGFGFIAVEDGEGNTKDYFFHISGVDKGRTIKSLRAGDRVSFEISENNKGECATHVVLESE